LILGDGIYNVLKISILTVVSLRSQLKKSNATTLPISDDGIVIDTAPVSYDEERRNEFFSKDQIPWYVALGGYVVIAAISIGTVPQIFPQLKWYHILVAYIFAPLLAFCNAYGSGLTDWSLVSTYGKLAIFAFGAWVGGSHGGVLAGLAACGVMMNIVGTAADLMGDFKTGYLTLASPRSMFISQVIGTAMGCVIAPCVFWLFYKAFGNVGVDGSAYPAPYAAVYRSMAILGVDGFSSLPKNCLNLCYVFFAARGDHHQPDQGPGAPEGVAVHPDPDGDGHPFLHRSLLRGGHVRRDGDTVRVAEAGQSQSGRVRARDRVRHDLRRWDMGPASVVVGSCQAESADLHEVPVEDDERQG
jgi:hypothetical protein